MTSYLILFGIFAAVTILVGAIFFLLYDANTSTTEDRLEVLTGKKAIRAEDQSIIKEDMVAAGGSVTRLFGKMFEGIGNIGLFFEQADSPIRPDMFFLLSFISLFLGTGVGWASHAPIPLWPIFALFFSLLVQKMHPRFQ